MHATIHEPKPPREVVLRMTITEAERLHTGMWRLKSALGVAEEAQAFESAIGALAAAGIERPLR